ncbi:Hpt domain protein [Oceaniovalibus guishaninsula JLT2003]|uniref:Hpt domain protein n=1 Tax=Oceaniovalibus guishaninsula JLT2003 TaxID=1231392 RepID=K2HDS4_9RHOB|nr:Hpt domain-containing protein [Oceaniovalibus guishaninsula]EKE44657.1 Hpt domain protein [Oceaniovalibus guishaninsula JLT2003]
MIAWDRVRELRAEMDEADFAEVVDLFLDEMDTAIMGLNDTGAPPSPEDLHAIKGCAANLGFLSLAQMCLRAERQSGGPASGQVVPGDIVACYVGSRAEFLEGLSRREAC